MTCLQYLEAEGAVPRCECTASSSPLALYMVTRLHQVLCVLSGPSLGVNFDKLQIESVQVLKGDVLSDCS
jgi:hypothetical protein